MAWLESKRGRYVVAAFVLVAAFIGLGILHYSHAHAAQPQTSSIVLTYRNAGGQQTDVDGLRDFLREHHVLAVQLHHDCLPIQMEINQDRESERGKEREMAWVKSDEGHICLIAREASGWPAGNTPENQRSK